MKFDILGSSPKLNDSKSAVAVDDRGAKFCDRAGVGIGIACAVKCAGIPLAAACLPSVSQFEQLSHAPWLHSQWAHAALLALAIPAATKSLIFEEICRRKPLMAAISVAALTLMAIGTIKHRHEHTAAGANDVGVNSSVSPAMERLLKRARAGDEICGLPSTYRHPDKGLEKIDWAKWSYATGGIVLGAAHLSRLTRRREVSSS